MVRGVEMLCGMLILRRIAAAYMPTFKAKTQVYPRIPNFQTILATIRTGRDPVDMIKMCTLFSQYMLLLERIWGLKRALCCFRLTLGFLSLDKQQ